MADLSRSQIDKLGERLKKESLSDDDLKLLNEYRLSFSEAYGFVVGKIKEELGLAPTGRLAKSTTSISEKLRRETIRLTQVQDIAGCRIVVSDIPAQNKVTADIVNLFNDAVVVDRRAQPSHGYRAVHVIVKHSGKLVEVQIRTNPQHLWAELSEKLSDEVDPALKYGGGGAKFREVLATTSEMVANQESLETEETQITLASIPRERADDLTKKIESTRALVLQVLQKAVRELVVKKG